MNTIKTTAQPALSRLPRCLSCATRSRCVTRGLAEQSLSSLQPIIVERSVRRGEQIESQGAMADNISVIKVGMAVGSRHLGDTKKTPVCLLGPGRLLGFSALFGLHNALGTEATTPLRLCEIPISTLHQMGLIDHRFQQALYQAGGAYFENLADWAHVMRAGSIKRQLIRALLLIAREMGSAAFRMPSHIDLASLLSTRRETIARYLAQLEADGFLEKIDRWHCRIRREGAVHDGLA